MKKPREFLVESLVNVSKSGRKQLSKWNGGTLTLWTTRSVTVTIINIHGDTGDR